MTNPTLVARLASTVLFAACAADTGGATGAHADLPKSGPETSATRPAVSRTARVWHTVTLTFDGPDAKETDDAPNPFLDYRLQVEFTAPDGDTFDVPGYFAGDGTGEGAGHAWRVHFAPDEPGRWHFRASMRAGDGVAVADADAPGESVAPDGVEGALDVEPSDAKAPDLRALGRLGYAGSHYLRHREGTYWIKGGTDEPENLLAYRGFHGLESAPHGYDAHIDDWQPGDPDWGGGRGKGLIGALNYLASQHVNSVYFLPMNVGGDGQDTWPFVAVADPAGSPDNDDVHYDVRRMDEWELVFAHAEHLGIALHVVLNEAEEPNKRELDDATLGVERKLFYRELVARFAHHNAIVWNLCEEYNFKLPLDPTVVREFAAYLRGVDPYDHPITVHHAFTPEVAWRPFLGDPLFDLTSFQVQSAETVEAWRVLSEEAGRALPIGMDEFFPDVGAPENLDRHRREYMWPIYLSGGNLEFILDEHLTTNDFRRHEARWQQLWYARSFVERNMAFWEMTPDDTLLAGERGDGGQVLAKAGETYAVYLPQGGDGARLDTGTKASSWSVHFYDPRTGAWGAEPRSVAADVDGVIDLGEPPADPAEDWAVLVTRAP